ncbi:carboxypeptidase regulatory-like domain-containing protein [Thermoactinomyces sp. CICC 10522]|jgi:Carboxypeptidase regulatory-like domain|nr:carboxypeptidase regulatory-like domain-containing protein [Thermoactinomyces sp. CICC 10522]
MTFSRYSSACYTLFFLFLLLLPFSASLFANEGKSTISGQVTDHHGFPLEHVLVFPEPAGKTAGPIPDIAVYTDRNGCFAWHVPPGRYQFRFQKNGYQPTYIIVQTEASQKKKLHIKMIPGREQKKAQPF